jgi:DNA excision repair protein ERCC-8
MNNAVTTVTIPSLLKLREEGRNHFYEFQRRLLFGAGGDGSHNHNNNSSSGCEWTRSDHQILQTGIQMNPLRERGGGGTTSTTTTSMDYGDSRFLLTGNQNGTVQIFDMEMMPLLKRQQATNGHPHTPIIHEPLQQAIVRRGDGAIRTVQWYPVDTGMFLTASSNGSLRIWDTKAMECVLNIHPFQSRNNNNNNTIHAMHISRYECTLAAVAGGDRLLKIVDLRSGASAHTLPTTTTTTTGGGAIQCVQWSPVSSHLLFSCGRTSVPSIWDVRRPGPPVTHLDTELAGGNSTSMISKSYSLDGSHWRCNNHNHNNNKRQVVSSSRFQKNTTRPATTAVGATAGVWDASGTHLVTVSGDTRRRTMDVWDMRQSPFPVRYRRRFVSETGNGPPIDANAVHQPLAVSNGSGSSSYKRHDQMIWVAKGTRLCGYSMIARDSEIDSGKPQVVLSGHLARIECILASEEGKIFTSALDGLILVWEPCNRFQNHRTKKQSSSSTRLFSLSSREKRPRPTQQVEDVDLW